MILILKTGSTLDNIKASHGDFEDWIVRKMHIHPSEYHIHPTGDYNHLPPEKEYSGIIITGSPDMLTEINLQETRMQAARISCWGNCLILQRSWPVMTPVSSTPSGLMTIPGVFSSIRNLILPSPG